jgi:hypothetical protein
MSKWGDWTGCVQLAYRLGKRIIFKIPIYFTLLKTAALDGLKEQKCIF